VPGGEGSKADRIQALVDACGYSPDIASDVEELAPPAPSEVRALRDFDRQRLFLN
jgi:hypothetical protein